MARSRADTAFAPRRPYVEPPTIRDELIAVLTPHPKGLRRWSVMRAIRENRNRDSRPMSLKFESEVERVFRAACSGEPGAQADAPFYRPAETAGEVWAVHPHALARDDDQEPRPDMAAAAE